MPIEEEVKAMSREELELFAVLSHQQQLAAEEVLRHMPECPEHGAMCLPHYLAWIEKQVGDGAGPINLPVIRIGDVEGHILFRQISQSRLPSVSTQPVGLPQTVSGLANDPQPSH
jgi:hypothetical protein